ncbi:MAG: hypothetical protein ACI4MW_05410 [Christensenellales bacterium]
MKKTDRILKELNKNAPDVKDKVVNAVDWDEIAIKNGAPDKARDNKSSGRKWKVAAAGIALILVAAISVILPVTLKKDKNSVLQDGYVVTIEVNPGVRFEVNASDVVTAQTGLNEDGVVLLYKENLVGKNIDEATAAVIEKMEAAGLIKGNVKISVSDRKGKKLENKQNDVIGVIRRVLNDGNIETLILSDKELDDIEDYYEKHGVSEYEKEIIEKFREKLLSEIEIKISGARNILALLEENKNSAAKLSTLDETVLKEVKEYCNKYKIKWNEIKDDEIREFYEDLTDKIEDLEEAREEIGKNKDEDDYGDMLEDLFEIVEEELFEEND